MTLLRRSIEVVTKQGLATWFVKVRRYVTYRLVTRTAGRLEGGVNSPAYWNLRLKRGWTQVGGGVQTQLFAIAAFTSIPPSRLGKGIQTILDFGCATGDAVPVIATAHPNSKILLHDVAPSGVQKGVAKYSEDYDVSAWNGEVADLVFSSNVLEHFVDPSVFFDEITASSRQWLIVQCPWDERHESGEAITPENPNGEHFWTIDEAFLGKYLPKDWIVREKILTRVPVAWPFGDQLILLMEKGS